MSRRSAPARAKACPHADIQFCPLYHAMHGGQPVSCADGRLAEGTCAVARGLDYAEAVARLDPCLVATLKFEENEAQAAAQRRRNMHALRLH